MPGVTAVVPDRTFYAQALVDGRPPPTDGQREDAHQGHGWSSTRLGGFRLTAGQPPRQAGEVVVDRALGLPPGGPVTLLTAAGPQSYTVTGLVDAPGVYVADEVAPHSRPVSGPSVCSSRRTPMPRTSPRRLAVSSAATAGR